MREGLVGWSCEGGGGRSNGRGACIALLLLSAAALPLAAGAQTLPSGGLSPTVPPAAAPPADTPLPSDAAPPTPASSATPAPADSGALGEIVVTAQKRSENVQSVPIAVTALTDKMLVSAGISDTNDLKALTPGLNFNTNLGGFGQPRVRGIGTTATGPGIENPTATYVDGVYIGTSAGTLFSLADVEQVAVLKGPQGTLFGRNATGGLIQVTTRAPSQDFHADLQGTYGNYDTTGGSAFITGGLTDTVAASIAAVHDNQNDGFGKNLYNGKDVQSHNDDAVRGKLKLQPDASTRFTLSGDYERYSASDPAIRTYGRTIFGYVTPGNSYDIDLNVQPRLRTSQYGGSLTAQHDFSGVQLLSITAYRHSFFHVTFDADQLPIDGLAIDEIQRDQQFSQEVQLQSNTGGPFKWTVGAYYFWSQGEYDPLRTTGSFLASQFFPLTQVDLHVDQRLHSYAGFAQASYEIARGTNLTGGLRYTSDHRTIEEDQTLTVGGFPAPQPALTQNKTFNKLTWRFSVDHRFSPEVLAYASYNRGFKSGSFAPDTFPIQVLKPETLDAYEVGLKTDLFDRHVRFNISAFYYDQNNLQVNQIVNGVLIVYNANGARSYGVDADLQARITDQLSFNGGISGLHARYKSFRNAFELFPLPAGGNSFDQDGDASGNKLQNTPAFTFNAGASYDIPTVLGKFTLAANYYYNDGYFADPQNRVRQNRYNLLDTSLSWFSNNGVYSVRVWVKNLTNQFYTQQVNSVNFGDNSVAAPPRTYGVTAGLHF